MRIPSRATIWLSAASALALGAVTSARAGTIIAKADITFCEVRAVDCLDVSHDDCPLVFNSPLAAGEAIISDTGSLCYRRNISPDDCSSALEQDWRCITNFSEAPRKITVR